MITMYKRLRIVIVIACMPGENILSTRNAVDLMKNNETHSD